MYDSPIHDEHLTAIVRSIARLHVGYRRRDDADFAINQRIGFFKMTYERMPHEDMTMMNQR